MKKLNTRSKSVWNINNGIRSLIRFLRIFTLWEKFVRYLRPFSWITALRDVCMYVCKKHVCKYMIYNEKMKNIGFILTWNLNKKRWAIHPAIPICMPCKCDLDFWKFNMVSKEKCCYIGIRIQKHTIFSVYQLAWKIYIKLFFELV